MYNTYIISSVECVFENLFENHNESSIENKNKKKKKKETFNPGWYVIPTGTKGTAHVARPGGLFSPGWYYQPGLKADL